jgi:hypothetical protein
MMRRRGHVRATVALLALLASPACSAEPDGFSDGRELLEATDVCAGPIERRDDDSWICPSGRFDDSGEAVIVAEVHDDPARTRETLDELLEFSPLLDHVVLGEGWFVCGLSSYQATEVIKRVGGRVISRGRPRDVEPRCTSCCETSDDPPLRRSGLQLDTE